MRTTSIADMARLSSKRRRSGHTLVELVVSVAVSGILVAGLTSTLYVASRAVNLSGPPRAVLDASMAAADVLGELEYAVTFTERSANAVQFTVADRNGDEAPETIRYAWSGTPGDPLTRQYNGGSIVDVLKNVHDLQFYYPLRAVTEEQEGSGSESAETLLAYYDSLDVFDNPEIENNLWAGQYIIPSLPADAINWKVTKVKFNACRSGKGDGEVGVHLQLPTAGDVPDGVVLESWTLLESTLIGDFSTQEFAVSNASGLSPDKGICLVVRYIAGNAPACMLQGQGQNNKPENGNLVESTDQGTSWSGYTDRTLLYELYGTVTTPGKPQTVYRYYLARVGIALQVRDNSASRVNAAVHLLNAPEVPGP